MIPNALRSRHGGTRFSQTIIHSALYEDLNEKRPGPSNKEPAGTASVAGTLF
jgi:hypothetical protein